MKFVVYRDKDYKIKVTQDEYQIDLKFQEK